MKVFSTFFLIFSGLYLSGQNTISGSILGDQRVPLLGATVVLLDQDSTMLSFNLTNEKGLFQLEDIPDGQHILQVSYLSFANYSKALQISSPLVLEPIIMKPSSEVLTEVTIKAEHIPMGISGDTISYNAAAFKTRPNATVEDLLKKLPGIEVDRNGNISAQGEDVNNVLVDGKEFFGSDPKMATQNLVAEAVDKVEVYDKKSDIAEFTGVDDGDEEKTINLKLKEDFKKGGFGTALIATGTDSIYESKLNYFRFTPKLQASAIFAANNINEETFSINDRIDFMGGMMEAMASGTVNLSESARLEDGINSSLSSGININYDVSDRLEFRSHYVLNKIGNKLARSQETVGFSDQFDFSNISNTQAKLEDLKHQINSKIKYKSNPLAEIIFKNNFSWSEIESNRSSSTTYTREAMDFGSASSDFAALGRNWDFDSNLLIKKKFVKKGRNLITSLTLKKGRENSDEQISNVNQISFNDFKLEQNQNYSNTITQVSGKIDYTEPLTKKFFLGTHYQYGRSIETPLRNFDVIKVDFRKNYIYNLAGLTIKRNSNKLKLAITLKGQLTKLVGNISAMDEEITGNYVNLLPSFIMDYEAGRNQSITSSLRSRVIAPELEQLAPIQNNTFPDYKFIGNPNLDPAFEQRLDIGYNYFDNFNFTSFWARFDFTRTRDRIVMQTEIDDQLFRTVTPINTDNYFSIGNYLHFSKPFKPLAINYKIKVRARYANYESFLNNQPSLITDSNLNLRFSVNNRKTKYFSFESGVSWQISGKRYAINDDFNQVFANTNYFIDGKAYLPKAWIISSKLAYNYFSNEAFSESNSFALLSATISKFFFANKLELRLSAFDLLNQNQGIRRYSTQNSLVEDNFNNLSRYFLLGISYKIGNGKKPGIQVEFD